MVLGTEWAEVEAVELLNDGSGLGFGIVGGRSTGVVVKTVLPGGVADRVRSSPPVLRILVMSFLHFYRAVYADLRGTRCVCFLMHSVFYVPLSLVLHVCETALHICV